jgi:putative ATPase
MRQQTNERVGYGEDYKYSHDYQNNFTNQEYLPDELKSTPIYLPGNNTRKRDKNFLKNRLDKYGCVEKSKYLRTYLFK